MHLKDSVRRTIQRFGLLPRGSRVVVALSGGADSVALLVVLREIAETEGFQLAGAAHLNHQLRGADADADEEFCQRLAASLDVPLHVERIDVASRADAGGISLEQAAHDARAEFFARAAALAGASSVAVAHTKNDQGETFLLRLLRGAGPRGLSGMHPRSGLVVRPFLDIGRADVRAFLEARRIGFREDATNDDRTIPRNRVRHELVPFLEARFSPRIVDVLDREATIAREDAEYLDAAATTAAERLMKRTSHGVELSVDALLAEPPAIARRVIRMAQQVASGGRFVGFETVAAVLELAGSNTSGPLDFPGHRVNRRGETLVLTKSIGRQMQVAVVDFAYQLGVPGSVEIPEAACAISADVMAVPSGQSATRLWTLAGGGDEAVVEAGGLMGPLSVRNRRPGDRFRPLGLRGRKKLQDLFVDKKIARARRDITPVIVDSTGQIIWVAGHALAEEFRVTDRTKAVVILKRVPI
ncbi:MAG TPA: tRNA lysidine(34) synthetase TilS [Vicinamibacterales bacterium]|nr:tRNA lysidine(34) synthetase TilS [Vicinamibacterales bacterium]